MPGVESITAEQLPGDRGGETLTSTHNTHTFSTGVGDLLTKAGWEGKQPLRVSVIQ